MLPRFIGTKYKGDPAGAQSDSALSRRGPVTEEQHMSAVGRPAHNNEESRRQFAPTSTGQGKWRALERPAFPEAIFDFAIWIGHLASPVHCPITELTDVD